MGAAFTIALNTCGFSDDEFLAQVMFMSVMLPATQWIFEKILECGTWEIFGLGGAVLGTFIGDLAFTMIV